MAISMEHLWFLLVAMLCFCAFVGSVLMHRHSNKLPPGPPTIPFLGNLFWLIKSSRNFSSVEPVLRQLHAQYGPIVTLQIGSRPSIFVADHESAHRILVQGGSLFASRPMDLYTTRVLYSDLRTVVTSPYGSLWRLLRKNFLSFAQPSRLHLYSDCRKWSLDVLKKRLLDAAADSTDNDQGFAVVEIFQHAIFCLLVYMCFGEKFEEKVIREIEAAQRASVTNFIRFNVLNFMPRLGKFVFRSLWKELIDIRRKQEDVLIPLIRIRQAKRQQKDAKDQQCNVASSYIDSLLELQLPDDNRSLSDGELVGLCSEFLNGGTDTSTTTLQWAMANLVKHQDIQEKLVEEINSVVQVGEEIKEEDLKKMPYLKAVVLETLRRHPPGHFIFPHAVKEDTKFDGYDIPANAMINFAVAEMSLDPNVWEDPMEFKPERFMIDGKEVEFDLRGGREIKMMPFGAGRRVCPAISVALLHQEYFVANLVRDFKWTAPNGCEIDLSEKQDFTVVMKNPLRVRVCRRMN